MLPKRRDWQHPGNPLALAEDETPKGYFAVLRKMLPKAIIDGDFRWLGLISNRSCSSLF